mgnify:CR=1 FL=1
MGEQMKEMGEEHLQLKSGAQAKMAAVDVQKGEAMEQARLEKQKLDDAYNLQKDKQDKEAQLARDKALDEFNLKKWQAEREQELEEGKCAHEKKMADEKMALERNVKTDAMLPDEVRQAHYKQELMQTDVLPPLLEQLKTSFGQISESMNQLVQLQQQTLQAILAPKSVSISGVKTDSQGNVVGASVDSKPMMH